MCVETKCTVLSVDGYTCWWGEFCIEGGLLQSAEGCSDSLKQLPAVTTLARPDCCYPPASADPLARTPRAQHPSTVYRCTLDTATLLYNTAPF